MKRVLLSGASGFLGSNFFRHGADLVELHGFSRTIADSSTENRYQCDICDETAVKQLLDRVQPDVFCHFAAVSQIASVNADPVDSAIINIDASEALARECAERGIRFLFTSTDLVFSGDHAPYDETAEAHPRSLYGQQKLQAETAVCEVNRDAVIVRMPLMYGVSSSDKYQNFTHQLIGRLQQGELVKLFVDEFRTPVSAACAVKGIMQATDWPAGLYHLGGHERLSRFDMGLGLARALGVAEAQVEEFSVEALPAEQSKLRARDVSMNSQKAFALGYQPLPFEQGIRTLL